MEGFESDWNYVDASRRYTTYTNLDPGTYSFHVIAANNDGVWNTVGRTLPVVIRPHWWNTWWFRSGLVILVIGVVTLFAYSRLALVRQRLRNAELIRASELRYRRLADRITDVFFALDNNLRCTYWNRASVAVMGIPVEQALGCDVDELIPDNADRSGFSDRIRQVLRSNQTISFLWTFLRYGREISFENSVYTSDEGVSVIAKDITDRVKAERTIRTALAEKEVLLKELHHRTKNNMQVIQSLLSLHAGRSHDERTIQMVDDVSSKIHAMALVHQMLDGADDLSSINLTAYIRELASLVLRTHSVSAGQVVCTVRGNPLTVLIDTAVPLGLVVSELLTNALKHAFPGRRSGRIWLDVVRREDGSILVDCHNDGVGTSPSIDLNTNNGFGISMIRALVREQLKGDIRFRSDEGIGCTIEFTDTLYQRRV